MEGMEKPNAMPLLTELSGLWGRGVETLGYCRASLRDEDGESTGFG